jgi:hypothetical protein
MKQFVLLKFSLSLGFVYAFHAHVQSLSFKKDVYLIESAHHYPQRHPQLQMRIIPNGIRVV